MRVLIADDDSRLTQLLERGLATRGLDVTVASDGIRALAALLEQPFDVAVLDVMMPGLDGLAVVREARTRAIGMPILLLTARGEVADRVRGLELGADDYLVKPFALDELVARINALARRAQNADAQLVVGSLRLDLRQRTARLGQRDFDLAPTEFRLLELLMRHPGLVLARSAIADYIWGAGRAPEGNPVDLYVHYLRRKLGNQRLIATVRGLGYRLEAAECV